MNDTERLIRSAGPSFMVCWKEHAERFHSSAGWWRFPLRHEGGSMRAIDHVEVTNGFFGSDDRYAYHASFALNDSGQMDRLEGSVWNAEHGMPYFNPFWREHGWYVVVADGFEMFPEETAECIRRCYESGGHRVLVVFSQEEGADRLSDSTLGRLRAFADEFASCHDTSWSGRLDHSGSLDGDALASLNETGYYRSLSDDRKEAVLDALVDEFGSQEPFMDANSVDEDVESWRSCAGREHIHQPCFAGNVLMNYYARSRMDAYSKHCSRRSLNVIWHNRELMREVIAWQLGECGGRFHSNRVLSKMEFKQSYRTVSNLNQSMVYNRCRRFAVPGGIFYDPCAGWGGRMLAAQALGMRYVAIDANRRLVGELLAMAERLGYAEAEVIYGDSSDMADVERAMRGRKASLSFTCPPYWNEEHYSDDPCQSHLRFAGKSSWHEDFFRRMVENTLAVTEGNFVLSCDEKVDWSLVRGISREQIEYADFNAKREDAYYLIRLDGQ